MSTSIPALVNAPLLVWAREDAGYSQVEVAAKIKKPLSVLQSWELGESQPTLRQAEALAKLYDRPFSVFALPTPPPVPPVAAECRRLPGVRPGKEPPELRLAIRRLVQRRRVARHLYAEMGDDPVDFPLRATLQTDPEHLGERMRKALEVTLEQQFAWNSEYVAFRAWREAVERIGVLVCQFPGGGMTEVRGMSILHFPLPVAGVSSKELPLSKPFTLLHEVAHLALAAGDAEHPALEEEEPEADWLKVERFCETAAAAALMPATVFHEDKDVAAQAESRQWHVQAIRNTARRFRVTPTAVATRALRLGLMSPRAYSEWKKDWEKWRSAHPDRPGGMATPAEKAVTRSGPLLTSLVLEALASDRISSADAASYLEVGYAHVEDLQRDWTANPATLARINGD